MSSSKVGLSSYKNAKSMEEKNRGTKVLQFLLSRGKDIEDIQTMTDLRIAHDIVVLADIFWYWNNRGLLKEEIALYKEIAKKYAIKIKNLYFQKPKPKQILEEIKKMNGETEIEHKQRMFEFDEKFRLAFDALARLGDFDSFIIAMEWDRPDSNKFYLPRRDVLIKNRIIQDLQDLFDGKIRFLLIEAPPGIGKSVLGEFWCCYRNLLYPNARGLIGNATSSLTKGFYNDMCRFLSDSEYRAAEIFNPNLEMVTDAEYTSIYFGRVKRREPNVMCASIETGATGKIHLNEEGYLYLDDTIKNSEEANNKDRLQKIIYFITSTFMDRRESDKVPVLHIGTPWSLYDFASYLKKMFGEEEWFRVNSTPAYYIDENGKEITNFAYEGKHYKSVEYWKQQISIDDPVIANAKFLMQPVEREGRLFEDVLTFTYKELENMVKKEKPYICSAVDVAVEKGGDYFSQGIFYVFEDIKEVWLVDVIYSNKGTDYTLPASARKILQHKVEKIEFEEKEGSLDKKINFGIANTVREMVNKLSGGSYKCNFSNHSGAGLKSKTNRISTYSNAIAGIRVGDDYIMRFLCEKDRKRHPEYALAMQHLFSYSTSDSVVGKQIDDFPDMLSMNFAYNILSGKNKVKFFNIRI